MVFAGNLLRKNSESDIDIVRLTGGCGVGSHASGKGQNGCDGRRMHVGRALLKCGRLEVE